MSQKSQKSHTNQSTMDLELASVYDIAEELAKRGLQFVIAIQVINNNEPPTVHLCVDSKKDTMEVANVIAPLFEIKGYNTCSEEEQN